MRLSRKLALGAAAGVVPFLVGQSPAAAAVKQDDDSISALNFTSTGGSTVTCSISAVHTVDSESGDLGVQLIVDGGPLCQGSLFLDVQYVNRHGEAALINASSRKSSFQDAFIFDAGSTAVTVDYTVQFDDCSANCSHTLQTKTK